MAKTTVLIVDLSIQKKHAKSLRGLLSRNENSGIELIERPAIETEGDIELVCNGLNTFNAPDLFLFVVVPGEYERSRCLLGMMKNAFQNASVIVVADGLGQDRIAELLKCGASDFVIPPLNEVDIVSRIIRQRERARQKRITVDGLREKIGLSRMIGRHPVFLEELNKIPHVAQCDANVLITGETGTGKELFSRSIHYLSARPGMPFVPVNCGAIPKDLVENELFGHEAGSYTGASSSSSGLIPEAEGGTLFLDEIDNLPLASQVKILRFLQEKEFRPIGSSRTQRADVRVIAATNIDLEKAMEAGHFRHDLFYRLNIISIRLPALREHKDDIPLLAEHFLKKYSAEHKKDVLSLESDALRKLVLHEWPGNIRELENCMERAVVFSKGSSITADDISLAEQHDTAYSEPFHVMKSRVVAEFEKGYIQSLLLASQGNITQAASTAQKNRRAFWELIRKHRIDVEQYRASRI